VTTFDEAEQLSLLDETPTLLPDIPGKVHGIVQVEPFVRVQCDGCGYIHDGKPGKGNLAVIQSDIHFNVRRCHTARPEDRDTRRLCRGCREREWGDSTGQVRHGRPAAGEGTGDAR
jgi:hypothetical protein